MDSLTDARIKVIEAARRVQHSHDPGCSYWLRLDDDPMTCDCGHAELAAAIHVLDSLEWGPRRPVTPR